MASKPGPLTHWPWECLGSFKYLLLSPLLLDVGYKKYHGQLKWTDFSLVLTLITASRYVHYQLWISISRHQNGRSRHQIQAKSVKFEQVDRETLWDDLILLHTIILGILRSLIWKDPEVPFWNNEGLIIVFLTHVGPVEFLYYWVHRVLHHHRLYAWYHSHHHSSFVPQAVTAVVHPFAEHLVYVLLFSLGPWATYLTGTFSSGVTALYITWFEFVNNMGHCNFEFFPPKLFKVFPPLKYLIYTPSFHSLHHSQVNTNFSLFMPIYDLIYGTMDKSSDNLFEKTAKGCDEKIDYVYLTHPTELLSIFHLRLGFASFAAKPYHGRWYIKLLWPLGFVIRLVLTAFGKTFVSEKNQMKHLHMQTWVIPRYSSQYKRQSQRQEISHLIEEAVLQADRNGAKVLSLGLLNKDVSNGGDVFLKRYENLKIRLADGTTLAAAWVANSIVDEEKQVLIVGGGGTRLESGIVAILCQRGLTVKIMPVSDEQYEKIKGYIPLEFQHNLMASTYEQGRKCKTWLVGKPISKAQQMWAQKGTRFVPLYSFPLQGERHDCIYETTPAMKVPDHLENLHTCEGWLPRKVMSAWRVGGIVYALEGWSHHECQHQINYTSALQVWRAALKHGFQPFYNSYSHKDKDNHNDNGRHK